MYAIDQKLILSCTSSSKKEEIFCDEIGKRLVQINANNLTGENHSQKDVGIFFILTLKNDQFQLSILFGFSV